jgi:hypothetical protein
MAEQHIVPAAGAAQAGWVSILAVLDEDALAEVLRAAKAARTLRQWASLDKQLCRLARSRVPVCLSVSGWSAECVIRSSAHEERQFSGCIELKVSARDLEAWHKAVRVLEVAQQWTALQQLQLHTRLWQLPSRSNLDSYAAGLLRRVPALQRLRHLSVSADVLVASSAACIQRLTQLTFLQLKAINTATPAAADLLAMSAMTHLVELSLNWALAPYLPAGPEGPYCFPSSLV